MPTQKGKAVGYADYFTRNDQVDDNKEENDSTPVTKAIMAKTKAKKKKLSPAEARKEAIQRRLKG